MRARRAGPARRPSARGASCRQPPKADGRWSTRDATKTSATEWSAAIAQQLLTRHGIVTRETTASEGIAGGFSAVYQVLKAMEDAGRVRRGYFVAGLGGAQFAMPAALDQLRSMREPPEEPRAGDRRRDRSGQSLWIDAEVAGWRRRPDGPTRTAGALVVLVDGFLAAYLRRGERELLLFAPETEPQRSRLIRAAARALAELSAPRGMLLARSMAHRPRRTWRLHCLWRPASR